MSIQCRWFVPGNPRPRHARDVWAPEFPPAGISGVYAIAALDGTVLYVGESHTDRLRFTIARHFQIWNDRAQPRFVYDRYHTRVCWVQTAPDEALELEAEWTSALDPRDNLVVPVDYGYTGRPADDEVPF